MTTAEITAATVRIAAQYRAMEERELVAHASAAHRDTDLVGFVVRCLANPASDYGPLLDTVWERRHRVGVVAS